MAQIIADVMTRGPATFERHESYFEASLRMAAADTGDAIVFAAEGKT